MSPLVYVMETSISSTIHFSSESLISVMKQLVDMSDL